ncbi:VWA domain-containing protein [Myxococcota bacterium]|nr:VWA domain-containing protein [Myxococcota bacterium]
MTRWHLTAALAGGATLAALLAPTLNGLVSNGGGDGGGGGGGPVPPLIEPLLTPPPPQQAGKIQLTAGLDQGAVLAGQPTERLLVVTLKSPDADGGNDRPVNVSLVIDRSGSMQQRGKMDYAKRAARELIESLDASDTFSMVLFSDDAELLAPARPMLDAAWLLRQVDAIEERGSTNLYAGMTMGIEQVRRSVSSETVNRVVLLTDGRANLGVVDPDSLGNIAASAASAGVTMSAMGLGVDYNEDLLASLADHGGGSYRYVSDPTTLTAAFRDELQQMSAVVASGVAVDVDLGDAELVSVLGGYAASGDTDRTRIWLGDLYGGETRKIVLKVRVKPGAAGDDLDVGKVTLSDRDGSYAPAQVVAQVTDRPEEVERSVNKSLASLGYMAVASDLAEKAASAYAAGKKDESLSLLTASKGVAMQNAARFDDDSLRQQAASLEEQRVQYDAAAPESEAGQHAVKQNKATGRAWSR